MNGSKCRVCRGPAIIELPRHNANFCADHFLQLLDTYPEIGRGLLRSLVRRLAATAGPKKGARPATMTGMVWGPDGPPSVPPKG